MDKIVRKLFPSKMFWIIAGAVAGISFFHFFALAVQKMQGRKELNCGNIKAYLIDGGKSILLANGTLLSCFKHGHYTFCKVIEKEDIVGYLIYDAKKNALRYGVLTKIDAPEEEVEKACNYLGNFWYKPLGICISNEKDKIHYCSP